MNFAKTLQLNRKTTRIPKLELNNYLKRSAISTIPVQEGDIITFPDLISEKNATLTLRAINGNTFFQVLAVRGEVFNEEEDCVYISVNALTRAFYDRETKESFTPLDLLEEETDKENCLYTLFKGKSKEELLEYLQGKTLMLKAQEVKEIKHRDGKVIPLSINAFLVQ